MIRFDDAGVKASSILVGVGLWIAFSMFITFTFKQMLDYESGLFFASIALLFSVAVVRFVKNPQLPRFSAVYLLTALFWVAFSVGSYYFVKSGITTQFDSTGWTGATAAEYVALGISTQFGVPGAPRLDYGGYVVLSQGFMLISAIFSTIVSVGFFVLFERFEKWRE